MILIEHITRPDNITPAGRSFSATHRHKFIGGHIVGQIAVPIAYQHSRPDDRVEGNVILADEVVNLHGWVSLLWHPPGFPGIRRALSGSPFDGSREVTN